MKPIARLAQIVCDTPDWESDPVLVAEVKQLRKELHIGVQDDEVYCPPNGMKMETIHQLIADYQNGYLLIELSRKYNIHQGTIRERILKPLGVYVPGNRYPKYKLFENGNLIVEGRMHDLAQVLGVADNYIPQLRHPTKLYRGKYKILKEGDEGYES